MEEIEGVHAYTSSGWYDNMNWLTVDCCFFLYGILIIVSPPHVVLFNFKGYSEAAFILQVLQE